MKLFTMTMIFLGLVTASTPTVAHVPQTVLPIIKIDGTTIHGDQHPMTEIILTPATGIALTSLIPIRSHFIPEMLSSIADF